MNVLTIVMYVILAIFSLFLIAVVLLQSGKKTGVSGSVAGAGEALFGKKKARGYEARMAFLTKVASIGMIILSVALVLLQKFAA